MRSRVALGIGLGAIASFAAGMGAHALYDHGAGRPIAATTTTTPTARATAPGDAPPPAVATDTRATAADRPTDRPTDRPAAPARSEHPVFDLVDNRHAAHRRVAGELVVDAAAAGFARYLRFGVPRLRWRLGQQIAGVRAAIAERVAGLELPLGGEQAAAATQITLRVHGSADHALALKVNGRKAADGKPVALVDGWQTISLPVAAQRLGVGENQVVLETSGPRGAGPVALAWLRVGAVHEPAADLADPRDAAAFDPAARTVSLARDAGLTWYVTIPDGAHLVADVGGAGCVVEVQARNSDGAFAGGRLDATHGRVDLTAMAGRVVALGLTARDCPRATLAAPRITMHGPAAVARPAADPPKLIVLWVMDALRADRIPTFTPGARARTPNFDELAKSSAVFRQYYVQGNESQTSHSSVWTGLYPAVHNVRLAGVGGAWKIAARFAVLAQQVADAGFYTAAVTGNGFVTEDGGYARGFREFRNMMRETGAINGVLFGEKIVDAVLKRIDAKRDAPLYMFFGTVDTHGPWIARKPWIDEYSPGPYDGPFQDRGTGKALGFRPGSMGCSIIPPKVDIDRLVAIYDSAVSYHDLQLGRFIAQLKSWGLWDHTMLIITADHGEEFFEDRRCGHGGSLRDTLVRVPLLIYDPARFPGGTVIDEGAEGVDVMPTVLDAIGAPAVPAAQGHSLVPLAQGIGRGWATPSYASQYEYAHAMRIGRWKIRVGKSGAPLIGDMVADPGEQRDASRERPVERRMLTDNIGMFLVLRTQWHKAAWGPVTNVTAVGAQALDGIATP